MKHIIAVQHTQSVHHTNGMVGSWTDWDLTELGRAQADRIGKKLKEELSGRAAVVYCSDLKRAEQTAVEIAKHLGVAPILRKELRERNLGRCCGRSVAWLRENMECLEKTADDRIFSDGESRRDAWNRLLPFFEEITSNDEDTVIIISHGDLLGMWNAMFLGLTIESLCKVGIHGLSGGVSHMIIDNGKRIVKQISDTSYIL